MNRRFADLGRCVTDLEAIGRRRRLRVQTPAGRHVIGDDGRRRINFASNDYLGLVADPPDWRRDAVLSIAGAGASPLVTGWTGSHRRLAGAIAALERTEAAIVFGSGFAACCGVVATLCRDGDLLLSDALNHASLIDGCRLSRADRHIYRHGDLNQVEELLKQHRGGHRRAWIVTDTIFSMDGDVAPLSDLVPLAERHDAELIVDEAHATGVLGPTGRGLCEALDLENRIAVRIGTLSKAVGLQGGFVAGPAEVIDYLIQHCRPFIFATALAPGIAQIAALTVERLPAMNDRRERLARRVSQYVKRIGGGDAAAAHAIAIQPHLVGRDAAAVELSDRLAAAGFWVPAIRPPTVPPGTARVRICLSAAHSPADVEALCDQLVR